MFFDLNESKRVGYVDVFSICRSRCHSSSIGVATKDEEYRQFNGTICLPSWVTLHSQSSLSKCSLNPYIISSFSSLFSFQRIPCIVHIELDLSLLNRTLLCSLDKYVSPLSHIHVHVHTHAQTKIFVNKELN